MNRDSLFSVEKVSCITRGRSRIDIVGPYIPYGERGVQAYNGFLQKAVGGPKSNTGWRVSVVKKCLCVSVVDIDECLEDGVCGEGVCVNVDGGFECQCADGYAVGIDGTCEGMTYTCESMTYTCLHSQLIRSLLLSDKFSLTWQRATIVNQ